MNKRHFTLIELLVVISVIMILAALTLGVFTVVRGKGRQAVCTSNLKQLGMAVHMYANDYKDHLPVSERLEIEKHLISYVEDPELFHCPSDNDDVDGLYAIEGTSYEWNVFVNGKLIDRSNFQILDLDLWLPIMYDGDFFHDKSKNQLFNDGSIQVYEDIDDVLKE